MQSEEELRKKICCEPENALLWEQYICYYERRMDRPRGIQMLLEIVPENSKLQKFLGDFFFERNHFESALEHYGWARFLDPRGKNGLKRLRELAQLFTLYRDFFSPHTTARYLVCNTVEKKEEFFPLFLYLAFRDREITVRQKASTVLKLSYREEKVLPWVCKNFSRFKFVDFEEWSPFLMRQTLQIQKETLLALGALHLPEANNIILSYLAERNFPETFQKELLALEAFRLNSIS